MVYGLQIMPMSSHLVSMVVCFIFPTTVVICLIDHLISLSLRKTLTAKCREKDGELYCLRCYDNMESAICAACR